MKEMRVKTQKSGINGALAFNYEWKDDELIIELMVKNEKRLFRADAQTQTVTAI